MYSMDVKLKEDGDEGNMVSMSIDNKPIEASSPSSFGKLFIDQLNGRGDIFNLF